MGSFGLDGCHKLPPSISESFYFLHEINVVSARLPDQHDPLTPFKIKSRLLCSRNKLNVLYVGDRDRYTAILDLNSGNPLMP